MKGFFMSKSIKKQLIFFLIVLCGVFAYNYLATRQMENMVVNSTVQERERAFMQKRAEYIKNHVKTNIAEQEINQELAFRSGHNLILMSSSSSFQSVEEPDIGQPVK